MTNLDWAKVHAYLAEIENVAALAQKVAVARMEAFMTSENESPTRAMEVEVRLDTITSLVGEVQSLIRQE